MITVERRRTLVAMATARVRRLRGIVRRRATQATAAKTTVTTSPGPMVPALGRTTTMMMTTDLVLHMTTTPGRMWALAATLTCTRTQRRTHMATHGHPHTGTSTAMAMDTHALTRTMPRTMQATVRHARTLTVEPIHGAVMILVPQPPPLRRATARQAA